MSYFDSSYIAKFYLDEPESEAVRRLAESLGQVRCAVVGQIEVACRGGCSCERPMRCT